MFNTTMQFVFSKIGRAKTACCWKASLKYCFVKGRNIVTLFWRSLRFQHEQEPYEEVLTVFMPTRNCSLWTNSLQNLSFFISFFFVLPFLFCLPFLLYFSPQLLCCFFFHYILHLRFIPLFFTDSFFCFLKSASSFHSSVESLKISC